MPKALESFVIARGSEGFLLQIEDEDEETREYSVTREQLELMAEEIERETMLIDEDDEDETEAGDEEEEI
jgi:hypothetical protein